MAEISEEEENQDERKPHKNNTRRRREKRRARITRKENKKRWTSRKKKKKREKLGSQSSGIGWSVCFSKKPAVEVRKNLIDFLQVPEWQKIVQRPAEANTSFSYDHFGKCYTIRCIIVH